MFRITYVGPDFKTLLYRLLLTGIIIFAGFNFGSWFYLYIVSGMNAPVRLASFSAVLTASVNKDLALTIGGEKITLKSSDLKSWLEPYQRNYSGQNDLRISSEKMRDYLKPLAAQIDVQPTNANLEFEDNRAKVFSESVEGKKLNMEKSEEAILLSLKNGLDSAELPIDTIEPEITLDKVNNLGINALLSHGESDFSGSHNARTHNIQIGAAKYNGVILKPGETFSFNDILGPVDGQSGYLPELVIKNGRVVPEFGGGLCQISTTVFRAAILAGFPIVERRPHSFPVKYYNPQGFDATIYPGVSDLRFVNNTANHVLLQTKITENKLFVEIYGSDDGRKVEIDGPRQYDQKPSGAMKAYFIRKIFYNGEIKKTEQFDSVYKAPLPLETNPLE